MPPVRHSDQLPLTTAHLVCEVCHDEIAALAMNEGGFVSKLYALRKEHAKRVHGWTEAPEDADAPGS